MFFVFTPSKKLKLSDHVCMCTHCTVMKWTGARYIVHCSLLVTYNVTNLCALSSWTKNDGTYVESGPTQFDDFRNYF